MRSSKRGMNGPPPGNATVCRRGTQPCAAGERNRARPVRSIPRFILQIALDEVPVDRAN